jgi:hypothetical protein
MGGRIENTKTFKIAIAAAILFMNIMFYTKDAPGMGTGFESAWNIHPLFGIFMSLVIGAPFLAYLYFIIKDV